MIGRSPISGARPNPREGRAEFLWPRLDRSARNDPDLGVRLQPSLVFEVQAKQAPLLVFGGYPATKSRDALPLVAACFREVESEGAAVGSLGLHAGEPREDGRR